MCTMLEIYYKKPEDTDREFRIAEIVKNWNGQITYREADDPTTVCLTIEFATRENANAATDLLRKKGEHIEGPMDYGDD